MYACDSIHVNGLNGSRNCMLCSVCNLDNEHVKTTRFWRPRPNIQYHTVITNLLDLSQARSFCHFLRRFQFIP